MSEYIKIVIGPWADERFKHFMHGRFNNLNSPLWPLNMDMKPETLLKPTPKPPYHLYIDIAGSSGVFTTFIIKDPVHDIELTKENLITDLYVAGLHPDEYELSVVRDGA